MRRVLPIPVLAFALAVSAAGQDLPRTSPTETNRDPEKPVVMTGCLAGGPSSYTLSTDIATPTAHEGSPRPVGTSAARITYGLTPRDGVDLDKLVGNSVEITGVFLPPAKTATGAASEKGTAGVKPGEGGGAGAQKPDEGAQADAQADTATTRKAGPKAAAATDAGVAASVFPNVGVTSVRMLSGTCR